MVNVVTFTNALVTGFKWEFFLAAPLNFVLWAATAGGLLFWGRGPFCGWLCPFGALQELTNTAAKWLKVPQIAVPWRVSLSILRVNIGLPPFTKKAGSRSAGTIWLKRVESES